MDSVTNLEKLQIQLSHWIKHNLEHAEEFRRWARGTEASGFEKVASKLDAAALEMENLNRHLQDALDLLEGSVGQDS